MCVCVEGAGCSVLVYEGKVVSLSCAMPDVLQTPYNLNRSWCHSSTMLFVVSCCAVLWLQVGMVFQSYALFNHLTVADNIKFGLQVGHSTTHSTCILVC